MVSEEFFVAGVDLRGYTTRKKALYKVFAEKEPFVLGSQLLTYAHFDKLTVITKDESINVEKIPEVHSIHLKLGHEGSVLKRPNSLYNLGKTTDWLRMKPVPTQDCEIVEAVYNKPGELTVVKVLDEKGVICKVNALGWNEIGLHINNESSILGKIIEVAYSHLTEAGLMREPRFVRFREDKTSE
jgi:ATP-dependent DNA ligase